MGLLSCARPSDVPSKKQLILQLDRERGVLEQEVQRDRQKLDRYEKDLQRWCREKETWDRQRLELDSEVLSKTQLLEQAIQRCSKLAEQNAPQVSSMGKALSPVPVQSQLSLISSGERLSVAIDVIAFEPSEEQQSGLLADGSSGGGGAGKVVHLRLTRPLAAPKVTEKAAGSTLAKPVRRWSNPSVIEIEEEGDVAVAPRAAATVGGATSAVETGSMRCPIDDEPATPEEVGVRLALALSSAEARSSKAARELLEAHERCQALSAHNTQLKVRLTSMGHCQGLCLYLAVFPPDSPCLSLTPLIYYNPIHSSA